jgi:hypothetical protein
MNYTFDMDATRYAGQPQGSGRHALGAHRVDPEWRVRRSDQERPATAGFDLSASGGRIMSIKQQQAVWELCRQGYQVSANQAARCWSQGERFEVERELVIARSLENLIDQCNWEVEQELEQA